jgi:protein SCO1/2
MTRRTLLLSLAAGSAALGAGVSGWVVRRSSDEPGRSQPPPSASERSIYALDSRWTTDGGRAFRLAELAGHVQLLGMMFTSCPSVCPTFVRELLALDRALPTRLRERTRIVLVSIDPERDTPEALQKYRDKMSLDRGRFTLLRGEASAVRELAQVIGVAYAKTEGSDIAHTRLVTVLDARGEVIHQQTGVADDRERLIAGIDRADGSRAG